MVICGVGVQNHGEFHELVQSKLQNLFYNQNCVERKPSSFKENDVRVPCQGKSQFALCFETEDLKGKNLMHNYLLAELLGQVEVNQFDKLDINRGLLNQNVYKKEKSVVSLEARNYHYSDAGFFMIRGQVTGNNVNNALEKIAQEMKNLSKLPKSEFERAKKALGLRILMNLSHSRNRTTELMK